MLDAVPETIRSTDDVQLRLYDFGGEGPLLVFAHATGFCGPMWGPVAATLRSQFRCVAFDFRAHGASTRPVDRSLEWSGMADDVIAVVSTLSPAAPVAAVGHSMGGAVLALAEDSRPGTISRAWNFEPILFESLPPERGGWEPSPMSDQARRRRSTFVSRTEVYDRYRSRPPLNVLDPRVLRAYVDHGFTEAVDGSVTLCCSPEDEAAVFERHNSGSLDAAGRLRIPYVVAVGRDGFPAEAGRRAAARFDNLELVDYPHLSHFGPLEDPERVGADIGAWNVSL